MKKCIELGYNDTHLHSKRVCLLYSELDRGTAKVVAAESF